MTDYDVVVDARGLRCPMPVVELAKHFGEAPVGGLVALLSDDPAAGSDVPAWCTMRGQEYVGTAGDAVPDATTYVLRRIS